MTKVETRSPVVYRGIHPSLNFTLVESSRKRFPICHDNFDDEHFGKNFKDGTHIFSFIKEHDLQDIDSEKLVRAAEEISAKLLQRDSCSTATLEFTRKLKKLTQSYRNVMEEFSSKLDKWSELRKNNIKNIQNSVQRFSFLKRTTTGLTLVSSTLEFLVGFGSLLHRLFYFNASPRFSLLMHVVSGLSMTYSFSALTYSNNRLEDIVKDIKEEKYLMRDLETVYRRGNWIDKEVQDLFPNGIDLKLINKLVFDVGGNLLEPWRQHISSAIILSNINKDKKLFHDEKFIASVKEFAESTAAQIWINRMKLRNLLDDLTKKLENLPNKKTMNGNEVFLNLAAVNLYPMICPLFWNSRKLQEMKFLFNSLAVVTTAFGLTDGGDGGFEDMKTIFIELQEDYKHIKRISKSLVTDYD